MDDWKRRVVRVCNGDPFKGGAFAGSAFLISPSHLLTARHVIEAITEGSLVLQGQAWTETRPAKITHHPKRDISLLTLYEPTEGLVPCRLKQPELRDGMELDLKGFTALDKGLESRFLKLHSYESKHDRWALHTTVAHGNSGGPALLGDRLVGVIQARNDDTASSYIIPLRAFDDILPTFSERPDRNLPNPHYLAALVDKVEQWEAMEEQVPLKSSTPAKPRMAYAFAIAGNDQEWPKAVKIKLCKAVSLIDPDKLKPLKPGYPSKNEEAAALWQVLSDELACKPDKESIEDALNQRPSAEIFWLKPPLANPRDHAYLAALMTAWESLKLPEAKADHFLLVIHEPNAELAWLDKVLKRDPIDRWIDAMKASLKQVGMNESRVLAKPIPPDKELLKEWVDDHLTYLGAQKEDVRTSAMDLFKTRPSIPHYKLREHLIVFINEAHRKISIPPE